MAVRPNDISVLIDNETSVDIKSGFKQGQNSEEIPCNGESKVDTTLLPNGSEDKEDQTEEDSGNNLNLLYTIDQSPPWYLAVLLGFQQYLVSFGSTLTIPLILSVPLCIGRDMIGLSQIIATFYFASGIATLLQTIFGVRLPIIQGATVAYLAPAVAILNLPEWKCPQKITDLSMTNISMTEDQILINDTEEWQMRIREIQGAISVASLFQVLIGTTGLLAVILRYVGPLTIAPTVSLIGISLFRVVAEKSSGHWWIAITTLLLIALFSQYVNVFTISLPSHNGKTEDRLKVPILKLFPILFAILVSWLLCFILTISGALTDDPNEWGYLARTDIHVDVVKQSQWIRVPYPGQWGLPTFNLRSMIGMLPGVIASVVESVGDYYACARFSGASPPPPSAINRGIAVEGIGGIVAGVLGTGNASTSYSENIASMSITKVGSLRVAQCAGFILIALGCVSKFGAIFVSIPDPVVGGLCLCLYGMILAVGLSNLQYVELNSSRNLFVISTSFFVGLALPEWITTHEDSINTGVQTLDQIFQVLLSTNMFVGGAIGLLLDVTLPGTPEERGLIAWQSTSSTKKSSKQMFHSTYQIPFCHDRLRKRNWIRFLPFCTIRYDDTRGKNRE